MESLLPPHGPTPETPATEPPAPAAAVGEVSTQILQLIDTAVRGIVGSERFIDRLAAAVVANQHSQGYGFGVPMELLFNLDLPLVKSQPTEQGNLLVLTQIPVQGGQNISVVVLAKENALVGQPSEHPLDNYTVAMYSDSQPGNLATRKRFNFAPADDEQLLPEFMRQLSALNLGECTFLYMNILTSQKKN